MNKAGLGWCLGSSMCSELQGKGGCDYTLASSALHAELLACHRTLEWAANLNLQTIEVWTDSSNMVNMLRNSIQVDMSFYWLVSQIKKIGSSFKVCLFRKVDREQILAADFLAKQASLGFSFSD